MTRPVEPGEVIAAKYEILRRIGRGGMGVVFEARHATIGRRLAVKFLRADLTGDEKRLLRFQREARNCGALHHENIAAVLDFATDDVGRPYIVMEFVDGLSLRELVQTQAPLSVERACDLACQAARGLGAAHDAGVLHRDLKPENLMLTRRADGSDWVKLVDFGVARLTEDVDVTALTRDGQTPGTPHYLAPEIARGEQAASVSSDVYSLGVVLFELLTGRRPHPDGSYNAVLRHVAGGRAVPISEIRPDLPASLARLVDLILSPDPGERPDGTAAVVIALQPFQRRDSRVPEAATVTSPGNRGARPTGIVHSRTRVRSWLLVTLLLIVALGIALVVGRRASGPEPSATPSGTTEARRAAPRREAEESPKLGNADEPRAPRAVPTAPTPPVRAVHPAAARAATRPARPQDPARSGTRAPGSSAAQEPDSSAGSFDRQNPYRD